MIYEKLTIHHYSKNKEDERRVTLSPLGINFISAKTEDVQLNGLSLREVSVIFCDNRSVDLIINHLDLETLERAIGSFSFE